MKRLPYKQVVFLIPLALVACEAETVHVPGSNFDLSLRVAFADIQSELGGVGSFDVDFDFGTEGSASYTLNYASSKGELTWFKEPEKNHPMGGQVTVRLQARSNSGGLLNIGGAAGPLDLGALIEQGAKEASLNVLVTRWDRFTPLGMQLDTARFLHTATATSSGILVVGGATDGTAAAPLSLAANAEWLDPFGTFCTSGGLGGCDAWGSIPDPRIHHVAVRLADAFAADCALADHLFIALGEDGSGNALSDAYLFNPKGITDGTGAFTALSLGLTGRIGATAHPRRDCKVAIMGGHATGDDSPLSKIELIDFATGTPVQVSTQAVLASPTNHAAWFRFDNAPDEIVVLGGQLAGGTGSSAMAVVGFNDSKLDVCDVSGTSPACNRGSASLACARASPVIARLGLESDMPAGLIVGDSDGPCGVGTGLELFRSRSGNTAPYHGTIPVLNQLVIARAGGHSVHALPDGSVIIVGGIDTTGTVTDSVESFALDAALNGTETNINGIRTTSTSLDSPVAYHASDDTPDFVLIVGGLGSAGPTVDTAVFAQEF